jgi:transposase InsO family protein
MTIYGSVLPGAEAIALSALLGGNLSERAKQRLKVLDWYRAHGGNVSQTARHFSVSRRIIRAWRDRLAQFGPQGLNDRSRRPHHIRRPTTSPEIVSAVVRWRKKFPAWSKRKIRRRVSKEGFNVSISTVGRILKRKGLINPKISRKRRKAALHPKRRYPHGMKIAKPGDLIQIDTKHIMLPGGKKWYQFTAIDVLGKRRVLEVYPSESSRNGVAFLGVCAQEFPFDILTVQTDNGAPWQKEFIRKCESLGLPHYFIQPRSPKQNTYVEISHEADEREFYAQGNHHIIFSVMRQKLKEWQEIWNEIRPHEALNDLTPNEYLERWQTSRLPTKDIITLQT